jgi:hypothetical protein
MVALARRLTRILFGMWRDQTEYQARRVPPTSANKRMSHLAGIVHRGDRSLDDDANGVLLVRAQTPCWLRGLCALTGKCVSEDRTRLRPTS